MTELCTVICACHMYTSGCCGCTYDNVADQRGLILTLTDMARYLDPELHCGPGLVGLATNIKSSHPKYDLKQPITTNNV